MIVNAMSSIARWRSVARAVSVLERVPTHVVVIAPCTRGAISFARALCKYRACAVTSGPITSGPSWNLGANLRTPAEIAKVFAGQCVLPRTVVSFPDQHLSSGPACLQIPFLGGRYWFSTLEALLVMRHRPPVFGLVTLPATFGFHLREVRYDDQFDAEGRLLSLHSLLYRMLAHLDLQLACPPQDWLARDCLTQKSEAVQCARIREELKDVECLLRMHLQSRYCDRVCTATALSAVLSRQKVLVGGL
jgi:hypothetical protein